MDELFPLLEKVMDERCLRRRCRLYQCFVPWVSTLCKDFKRHRCGRKRTTWALFRLTSKKELGRIAKLIVAVNKKHKRSVNHIAFRSSHCVANGKIRWIIATRQIGNNLQYKEMNDWTRSSIYRLTGSHERWGFAVASLFHCWQNQGWMQTLYLEISTSPSE